MHKNSKKQGDAGLGIAIGWFAAQGYTVCVPLTDSQDYDLIVDMDGLKRVQVKTTAYRNPAGNYVAGLRVHGGNRTGTGKVKFFNPSGVDLVFIVTACGANYLVPSNVCGRNSIALSAAAYGQYKVDGIRFRSGIQTVKEAGCKPVATG